LGKGAYPDPESAAAGIPRKAKAHDAAIMARSFLIVPLRKTLAIKVGRPAGRFPDRR
jgi:hypothetical protein